MILLESPSTFASPGAPPPAETGTAWSGAEAVSGLNASGEAQAALHRAAARAARAHFGPAVFVRGVVEVSNFCRQNCSYCGMRRDNRALARYRLDAESLFDWIAEMRPPAMTDINIQAGEDPVAVRQIVLPLVRALRERTDLGVSVCLGTLEQRDYDALHAAGASYFIIKLETGDARHYLEMQASGTLARRIDAIERLAHSGWNVSSGCIAGLPGQTDEMLAATLDLLASLPLAGVSVSPFIPGEQTRWSHHPSAGLDRTLNALALLRLRHPAHVIPAVSAFSSVGEKGYARALATGANLVTINLTPEDARENYVIYKNDRFIMTEGRVRQAVAEAGLECSTVSLANFLAADRQP
jgi:biotin synthase